jgi:hypothetical protein
VQHTARALAGICEKIVIPNLLFREEDEELFEDNPLECASAACNAPSAACNAPSAACNAPYH